MEHLLEYNTSRVQWHADIMLTGIRHTASRIWYSGVKHLDGSVEEFSESCTFPIRDLSSRSVHSDKDALFAYNITDIDEISRELRIPWETSKDQLFAVSTIYIGFVWNLEQCTVTFSPTKTEKYINEINDWLARQAHMLKHIQELYGKLLHAAPILPQGQAYLVGLEGMLATCAKWPFVPHHLEKEIEKELCWWRDRLHDGTVIHSIFPPPPFLDLEAYSDASSGVGICVTIGNRWRAWHLCTGWQFLHGPKDIGWAEAVAFEFLICTLDTILSNDNHVILHGDNTGIVEGWHVGRHRNHAVNDIFKHIHTFLNSAFRICGIAMRYVPSRDNPADRPSRGLYGPEHFLLPAIPLPEHLREFLSDATDPLSTWELRDLREGKYSTSATRIFNKQCTQQEATERSRAEAQLKDELVLDVLQDDRL